MAARSGALRLRSGPKNGRNSAQGAYAQFYICNCCRDTGLIDRLFGHVRRAANGIQPILVAVDGFAAYPKVILKHFATVVRSGKVGRPPRVPWADLHIVQVVKQHSGCAAGGHDRAHGVDRSPRRHPGPALHQRAGAAAGSGGGVSEQLRGRFRQRRIRGR